MRPAPRSSSARPVLDPSGRWTASDSSAALLRTVRRSPARSPWRVKLWLASRRSARPRRPPAPRRGATAAPEILQLDVRQSHEVARPLRAEHPLELVVGPFLDAHHDLGLVEVGGALGIAELDAAEQSEMLHPPARG